MSKLFEDQDRVVIDNAKLADMLEQVYGEMRRLRSDVTQHNELLRDIKHDVYMLRQRIEQR